MNAQIIPIANELEELGQRMDMARQCLTDIRAGHYSTERLFNLMESLNHQMELSCIMTRRFLEHHKAPEKDKGARPIGTCRKDYGEVEITNGGWLHIRLNFLLPGRRFLGGTQYISDSILRLLNDFQRCGVELSCFEKAFVAVVEHCDENSRTCFDNDNKGFQAVMNALKGRLFADDDQFELSLGLFTEMDDIISCHIYVLPEEEAEDFFAEKLNGTL